MSEKKETSKGEGALNKAAPAERGADSPGPDTFDMTMAIPTEMMGSAPDRLLEPALQIRREEGWHRFALKGKEVTIGHVRQSENHITLDDSQVSRRHAKILFDKPTGTYFFLDVGSTNGSWVNGVPAKPHDPVKLSNNDQIKVGETRINVYLP